jgi:hypothetical protein
MTTSPSQAMSATDLARNWGDEDQVVDGATGAHCVRYSFTAERFGHMLDAFAAALSAQGAAPAEAALRAELAEAKALADSEGTRAVNYLRSARKAEAALSRQAPAAPAEAPAAWQQRSTTIHGWSAWAESRGIHAGMTEAYETTCDDAKYQFRPLYLRAAPTPAEAITLKLKDPMLMALQSNLQIMMASAVAEGDEFVTGYRIKTGAIHRIIGAMQDAGYPVRLPALATPTPAEPVQQDTLSGLRGIAAGASAGKSSEEIVEASREGWPQAPSGQQAEPTDEQIGQLAYSVWGAQVKRLPVSAALQFARLVLTLASSPAERPAEGGK